MGWRSSSSHSRERNPVDGVLMREILGLKTRNRGLQLPTFSRSSRARAVEYIEDSWWFSARVLGRESGPAARCGGSSMSPSRRSLLVLAPFGLVAIASRQRRGPGLLQAGEARPEPEPYTMLKFGRWPWTPKRRRRGLVLGKSDSRVTR